MVRQRKHDRTKPSYPLLGREENVRNALIPWLNDQTMEPGGQLRAKQLIGLVRQMSDLAQLLPDDPKKVGKHPLYSKCSELAKQVNKELARYKGVRRTNPDRRIRFVWIPARYDPDFSRFLEFVMVHCILDAAEQNLLNRVRQCNCGKYFFARSTQNRFCSPACRISFWEK
jgi:hypothetical protein